MGARWVTHIYFFNPCCGISPAIAGVGILPPPAAFAVCATLGHGCRFMGVTKSGLDVGWAVVIKEPKNARFVQRHPWAIGGYMKCLWKGSALDGRQRTSTRPASRLAFTLIELLVVVAVIAILASMLLSALNRAKVQARIAACKSNLHQYGVGLRMYVDDYKGYPSDPAALMFFRGWLPGGAAWFQLLQPYTKDTWTNNVTWPDGRPTQPEPPGIQICPDYGQRGGQFLISFGAGTSYGSYGYNCLGYDTEGNLLGLGVQRSSGSVGSSGVPVRDGDVVCPSDMIAIGDAITTVPDGGTQGVGPAGSTVLCPTMNPMGFADLMSVPEPPPYYTAWVFQRQRHGHRWNVLLCDGHVEGALSTRAFLDPHPDAVLQRWNRDHQPHGTNGAILILRSMVP